MADAQIWQKCLSRLEDELPPHQFNTWIRPLQAIEDTQQLRLLAPNRFVLESVRQQFLDQLSELVNQYSSAVMSVSLEIGSQIGNVVAPTAQTQSTETPQRPYAPGRLSPDFTFENHVEGKSNQLARAASIQVGENPGRAYNPPVYLWWCRSWQDPPYAGCR